MSAAVSRPAALAATAAAPNRSYAVVLAVMVAVLALPLGVAIGIGWIDMVDSAANSRPVPQWVTPGTVRATTSDGTPVKARVALDVGTASGRAEVQRRLQQVGLVLEVSVGSIDRESLSGAEGITALSDDMRDRLNDYLRGEGVAAVKSVAIQDLVVGSH